MSNIKILIIDDENIIRESLMGYLNDLDYTTEGAENGLIGLEKFKSINPDIVIVDLRMPKLDGIGFIKEAIKINSDIPIIVASGTGDIQDAVSAINAGAWDYLTKPIAELSILEHRLKSALEKANLIKKNKNYEKYLEDEVVKRTMDVNRRTRELENLNQNLKHEINEKKSTSKKLSDALNDKEVLIKEIHHRVKNNLQIIASMLKLQMKNFTDENTIDLIKDIFNRVRAMAFIHEKLYSSDKMDTIAVNDYIDNIVKNLFISYGIDFNKIKLTFEYDHLDVDLDTAVPCGLIVNEIITNSLKYGFTGRETGEVNIKFKFDTKSNMINLKLSDNGIGFSDKDTIQKKSLGLLLIEMLTKQLDGNLIVEHKNGVHYNISFKYPS